MQRKGRADDPGPELGALISGEPAAWEAFVASTRTLLERAARAVVGTPDGAEDLVQSVYALLCEDDFRRLRAFRGESRLSTWLVSIVLAQGRMRERSDSRRRTREALSGQGGRPSDPLEEAVRAERAQDLAAARDRLGARDRLLLALAYEDERPHAEIAAVLGLSVNSISPLLARARQRLFKNLGVRSGDPAATEDG